MQCIGEKEREHKRSRDGGQGGHVHKVADRSVGTASLRSKTTKSDGVGEETEVSLESHTTPRFHVLNAMEMAAVSTYIDVDDGQTDGEVERNGELLMAHCRLFAAATLMQLMAPVGERGKPQYRFTAIESSQSSCWTMVFEEGDNGENKVVATLSPLHENMKS